MNKELVPDYLKELQTYQAGKPIDEVAREKGLTKISKLASNENPLGPSPFAIREMTKGLWDLHRYPDMHAFALKSKLAEMYNLKRENIILGNGSEGIMGYIARAFLRPGDEVLTCENTFIGFYILARSAGAKLKLVPLDDSYRFNVAALAQNITENTKVIYIANPNNPTGTYISKEEFDFLMRHVPKHVLVILDEAYFEFAIGQQDYPDSMDYRYDNVLTLRTFSKAYGLSGIRVGYGFAHEELISYLTKVKLPFEPNLIGQLGAVGALEDQPHLERTLKNNNKRYDELFAYLTEKGFKPIPSVTNFVTIKTGSSEASDHLFQALLNHGVIIRPLKANEMPDFVRISIGTKEEMGHFYEAMEAIIPEFMKLYGSQL
ncbi:histidinol-phosphate transaminase [Bacteriovorax sp. Seq25_V]|uniref:histidinol-phosphate transaminase n=1 Tax=Bacteriovorax sp. Seq25_V TaxID=1201288 RepID=UPI00038A27BF|nr:histidinol-phosphate transaminase [Bacteriovorax sp. Seq25_V]EQC44786.1 histidinol-phosphate transaminase [Bacteriovorax sp. Seq25_V]